MNLGHCEKQKLKELWRIWTSRLIWILVPTQLFTDVVTNKMFFFFFLSVLTADLVESFSFISPANYSSLHSANTRQSCWVQYCAEQWGSQFMRYFYWAIFLCQQSQQSISAWLKQTENTFSLSSSPSSCKMKTSIFYLIWDYLQILFQIIYKLYIYILYKLSIFIWPE